MDILEKPKRVIDSVPGSFSLERLEISKAIFEMLHPVLNEIHGTDYSHNFWKIVMGSYVNSVISVKHIYEANELDIAPLIEPINSHHLPNRKQKLNMLFFGFTKFYKNRHNKKLIFDTLAKNNDVNINLPNIEIVRDETGPQLPNYYPFTPGLGNVDKRRKVNQIAKGIDNIYHKNIVRQLSKIYVEHFDRIYNAIPLIDPAQKTFHVHGATQFYFSLILAKYTEHGARFICYQHGGFYGELIGHNAHNYESSISDEFHTWGWIIGDKDVVGKAYRSEEFKQIYDRFPNTNEYDLLMCFPDVIGYNIEYFKSATYYFLENLDTQKYPNLMARPRPMNKVFSHASRIAFIKDGRVTIDDGLIDMAEVVAKCKLVVQFNVPSTNFLECIYIDHPTIGVLDNDQPTPQIKPHYDFLVQEGVLHYNFISLVDHLNNVNIEEWWSELIKHPKYQEFKNEFIRQV